MNILITAIGSMSAECAITRLRAAGHCVTGCDIYPAEWHVESQLCDAFYRAPFATHEEEYVGFLLRVSAERDIRLILPLTDLEIDVINRHRARFDERGILLGMQSEAVLAVARDKYRLYREFAGDERVPSVPTVLLRDYRGQFPMPCVAKPYNGRSSEGLAMLDSVEQIPLLARPEVYILQQKLEGQIFTVDYLRCAATGCDMAVPRKELLRTKNGAGLTVEIVDEPALCALTAYIGAHLGINGCVNMEFILHDGRYYLIDINPRFSAGVAFSVLGGYDMVNNHVRCFTGGEVDAPVEVEPHIMIKKYSEVVL